MAVRPIVMYPDDRLRQKCKKIGHLDPALQRLVDDMIDTMHEANGLGLAAPQVGVGLRLCVVQLPEDYDDPRAGELFVLVNPEIIKQSSEWEPIEGCLSIPGFVANVKRFEQVTVKARDRNWREVRVKAEGLLAQAFQHEIDHLNGILYIDHLSDPATQLRRADEEPAESAPATVAS